MVIADPRVASPVAFTELARWVDGELVGDGEGVVVTDLVHDHRAVEPGAAFLCITGTHVDGHDRAGEAVRAGAAALIVERPLGLGVPELVVADTRAAMAPISAAFFGHPSEAMDVVGITGTNGKTTVAHLVVSICEAAGRPSATIGTLTGLHTTPTTPEASELHRHLAGLRADGTQVVALEVSSHALVMHRVDAMVVSVAVFTNLSRDHLDFHQTMDSYFAAKAKLFTPEHARRAVVNLDDPHGRLLSDAAQIPTVGYQMSDANNLTLAPDHSTFTWYGQEVRLPLVGSVNVSNALAAATVGRELGIDPAAIARGLAAVEPIRGRFEPVPLGARFNVMVDYAHTPDALGHLLEAARELVAGGQVHLVFGCGGDKDQTKRGPMGEVAQRLADHVVVTSDNPRSEAPDAIIADITRGMATLDGVEVEPDRRQAIAMALESAGPGDLVVVAGKGHETVQVIGGSTIPFDDRAVVIEEHTRIMGTAS